MPYHTTAKFTCIAKTQRKNWSASGPQFLYEYEFSAVTGTKDEDKSFFASTPNGSVKLTAVREDLFNPGTDYYLNFEPAS